MEIASTEIVQRGKALYEQQIRPQVEADNLGKVLVININTGEYEIDTDHLTASNRAAAKYPGAPLYAMRIGAPALGRLGSRSQRSAA
ncbi:MAG: hypothetical protein ACRYFS_21230 [Janthinobacterium lividum]